MSETQFVIPPGTGELRITHVFDAPVELVFKTWIDPEALPHWWGPAYLETTVEHMEPRHGGRYRILQRAPDGAVHGFRGVYHTVEAPHLIISTFEYDGARDHVLLETCRFEKQGNKTLHTSVSVFQSLDDRDAMVATGWESGVRESMSRLDELLQHSKVTP